MGEKKVGSISQEVFCYGYQIKSSTASCQGQRTTASLAQTLVCTLLLMGRGSVDPAPHSHHVLVGYPTMRISPNRTGRLQVMVVVAVMHVRELCASIVVHFYLYSNSRVCCICGSKQCGYVSTWEIQWDVWNLGLDGCCQLLDLIRGVGFVAGETCHQ